MRRNAQSSEVCLGNYLKKKLCQHVYALQCRIGTPQLIFQNWYTTILVSSGSVPHLAQRARIKTVAPSLGCTILSTNDAHTSRAAYQTWGQLSSSGLLLLPSSLRRLAFVQMSKQGSLSALSVSRGGGGNPKLNCNKQQRKLCCQVVCFRSDFGCILHKSGHVQIAGPKFLFSLTIQYTLKVWNYFT